jgi:RNA polymerase subunit RPABC4/transcription elongation factor Spt4
VKLRVSLAGATLVGLVSLLVHPFGAVKAHSSAAPLLVGAEVHPAVAQIVERSCQNCHSEKTTWPWYSYVAPVSWLIESDVSKARGHMNLSVWGQYTIEKREEILGDLAAAVRSRQMPPPRYTLMHSSAKLSEAESEQIYRWARGERRRLRSMDPQASEER